MWGYCTSGSCSTAWAPGPAIVIPHDPAGNTLQINLTNSLPVPTSIVILGQLGGGLGTPIRMPSPAHPPQLFTTFPGNGGADPAFTPPPQMDRARSLSTEVGAGGTTTLTWNNLRPGSYIYETATLPSLQAPMGLYGVLIVTQPPVPADATHTFASGNAYPAANIAYDSDATLLFSEIDPVQNMQVDAAAVAGTNVNLRFNDPACAATACYPAAVNYTPTYFLINGRSLRQIRTATIGLRGGFRRFLRQRQHFAAHAECRPAHAHPVRGRPADVAGGRGWQRRPRQSEDPERSAAQRRQDA